VTSPEFAGRATVVIVAAGRGERFGSDDKVLIEVGGRPVLEWSLIAAGQATSVADIVIVTASHTREAIAALVASRGRPKPVTLCAGGETRQASVAAGVAMVPATTEIVLVHDAARPLASAALFDRCASEAWAHGAAITATPVADTLKRAVDGVIEATLPRSGLWGAQTPQAFRRDVLLSAIEQTRSMTVEFTDEASLLEALGLPVRIVSGERSNIKVTHREDLEIVDALFRARSAADGITE
jgi:2-C-methyl-D-erythritol 4-phosphate cytidylyltransferase